MENIIFEMVECAATNLDFELMEYSRRLVYEMANTINCPINWRNIGEKLAEKYADNTMVYNEMQLYYYE